MVSVLLFLVLALRAVPSVDRSIVKKKEVSVKIKLTVQHFFGIGIERFRMTSRRPYWCPKTNETVAVLVSQTSPLGVELFSYANAFFCSKKFAQMLAT